MGRSSAEHGAVVRIALDGLRRYTLRTALSVTGIVLGVSAVIAMMSVSEGAAREALAQVEALGLQNLVARSNGTSAYPGAWRGLTTEDADRAGHLVPEVRAVSPLVQRQLRVSREARVMTTVLGVRPAYGQIVRLAVDRGRFLTAAEERGAARVCVLGATLVRQLFGGRPALGEHVLIGQDHYLVVGTLRRHGAAADAGATLAWHDLNRSAFVPFATLSGQPLEVAPHQPADEVWIQVRDGAPTEELASILGRALNPRDGARDFTIIVPRELLAQRYRTQRMFAVLSGSVAVLALVVGGIGITNVMLMSVVERTGEIGVRRTVGATRRAIAAQFLLEALIMTVAGGVAGIALGAVVAVGITAYAGWTTYVSPLAVVLGSAVSVLVGLLFGSYPAIRAARLEPVNAMRHE